MKDVAVNPLNLGTGQIEALDAAIRRAATRAIRRHPEYSREKLADRLSELLGRPVSASLLYSYTSRSHRNHRLSLLWAVLICRILDDYSIFRTALGPAGITRLVETRGKGKSRGRA